MKQNKNQSIETIDLRHRAEEQLEESSRTAHPSGTRHELQIHKIELEMQVEELRQARKEETIALEKYTDLFDFAPVSYFTLDRNGTIRAANHTGSGLLGVERFRLIGQRFGLLVVDNARTAFTDFLEKVFASPSKEVCEVAILTEGNSELIVQIEGVAAASGKECRIALFDVTERKLAEKALHLAMELIETASRTKSQFFANMSHELRTPMTGILGMLQLALEENLDPAPREYLETTLNSARSLLVILNDILDMAKIEAGKLTIEKKPFSLKRCLTEAHDIITPEVRRKGLDFAISVADDVPDMVIGDQVRLRQVLINLIGNAVKFTERGEVMVHIIASGTAFDGKRGITFAVTDTGIGIPDDKKELLFHVFSQVDASHSRIYGGSGLGLAICREIVELMMGTITFESKEGEGSSFSFTIPLEEAILESKALTPAEYHLPETKTSLEGEKIPRLLLVEDDPTIRQILELMFKRANYNIDIAEDGQKAVEMWEKGEYELVLMDIQMPHLNGFEVTRAIRKKEREHGGHTPIVAMTAHASKEDEERCLDAGMDAFISKPIDFMICLELIEQIIKQNYDRAC